MQLSFCIRFQMFRTESIAAVITLSRESSLFPFSSSFFPLNKSSNTNRKPKTHINGLYVSFNKTGSHSYRKCKYPKKKKITFRKACSRNLLLLAVDETLCPVCKDGPHLQCALGGEAQDRLPRALTWCLRYSAFSGTSILCSAMTKKKKSS